MVSTSGSSGTKAILAAALILWFSGNALAQASGEFHVTRTTTPPKLDGVLDDEVWKEAPLALGDWVSYEPVRGDKMSADLKTDVRIAYDDRNIYFAFHCFDNEPDKIRTNVSKRDTSFSDDWIAMSLDSAGTGQSAYHLFSNPSGSQMDAINTSASGEQFDADVVWYSVAKTTSDGYVVEVSIPLQSLRFSGADEVRMGLVFFRKISRIGVSYAWPEMLPGQWVFDRPAHLLFANLKPRRLVEALPSITYGVNQRRETADQFSAADGNASVGINGKLGITSGITLDGTINPDFSQVESDAFQVEVNQRFPVFFSEKRPFFMEGMGLFNIAGTGGDSNMRTAVHTRRIVNPMWGSKITGTVGKTTFGVLNSYDERLEDANNKLFTIGRATYALRRSDYIGAIVTDTQDSGSHNTVAGGDLSIRLSPSQQFSATALATRTSDEVNGDTNGGSAQAMYNYQTRRVTFLTQVEHYDRDFRMDTAFYNRTGFTTGWSFGEVSWYPKNSWLQRVHPFFFTKIGHDEIQDGNEALVNTGMRFNFTRQGFVNLSYVHGHEAWHGQQFQNGSDINLFGVVQAFRWLEVNGSFGVGPSIYYDEVNPFQGHSRNSSLGLTLQPNQHITESLDLNNVKFDRPSTGEQIYDITIVNSKTTYQFDKHFLVRLLVQYDSSASRVLTDLLASYELVPGTVFHAGYGSLYEKRLSADDKLVPVDLGERYVAINRGLFFKASYLHRF